MRLPEKVTFWNTRGNKGDGDKTFDGPITVDARIHYQDEAITDQNGQVRSSSAVVYLRSTLVKEGTFISLSVSDELEPSKKTYNVIKVSAIPSATDMRKVWL